MDDLTAGLSADDRVCIDAIEAETIHAERGHELASLRQAQSLTQAQVRK